MKRLFLITIIVATAIFSFGQSLIEFGLKGGLNNSKISLDKAAYNEETINSYHLGAYGRLNLGPVYIQPEAYYSAKGGKITAEYTALENINEFDFKTVDVPVLLGIKVLNGESANLRVMGGPVFSVVTDKDIRGDLDAQYLKDNFFGWQYGVGIDFLFLTLDARVESSSDDIYEAPDFYDTKNKTFVISLGIKLF